MHLSMDDTPAPIDIWKRPRPVRIEFEKLVRGTINQAADRRHCERTFRVLVGSGRDCVLHSIELPIVVIPLRGRLKLTEGDGTRLLHRGHERRDVAHAVPPAHRRVRGAALRRR